MESGHGKGPCDPVGGTAKRKADLAVKNDKVVIQNTHHFFALAMERQETSATRFPLKTTPTLPYFLKNLYRAP